MTAVPRPYVTVLVTDASGARLPLAEVWMQTAHPLERRGVGVLAPPASVPAGSDPLEHAEQLAADCGLHLTSPWQATDLGARAWLGVAKDSRGHDTPPRSSDPASGV